MIDEYNKNTKLKIKDLENKLQARTLFINQSICELDESAVVTSSVQPNNISLEQVIYIL